MPSKKGAGDRASYQAELARVIRLYAPRLQEILKSNQDTANLDAEKVLTAIACVESGYGANTGPRFEPAYYFGGKYYVDSAEQRALVKKWNNFAAMSWGPWQIMYPTAVELGLASTTPPEELDRPMVSAPIVIRYLEKRAISAPGPWKARCLADLFDAFNSGRAHDRFVPTEYIKKALRAYADPSPWLTAVRS